MSSCQEDTQVKCEGNTIFFFCGVDDDTVKEMCVYLKKLSMTHETIKLCIRSDGGDVYAGFTAFDYIKTIIAQGTAVETIAYGQCASAATFILLAGSKRLMGKNAYVLIHQLTAEAGGTYNDMCDIMKDNKKLMKHFRRLYLEHTEIPEEVLEKHLTRDISMSSRKCIKYQIVQELI